MLLGGQTTEFHVNAILPIASYTNGVGFLIQFAYGPKATPFAGEACETNRSLVLKNGKLLEDSRNSFVALFAAISQVSTWYLCALGRCMGVRQAMALIGNARQATSEGKSGPVETGLTGPATTALFWYINPCRWVMLFNLIVIFSVSKNIPISL